MPKRQAPCCCRCCLASCTGSISGCQPTFPVLSQAAVFLVLPLHNASQPIAHLQPIANCPCAGLLALPNAAALLDGKTPAAYLPGRRPQSDDAAARRATRHAASPRDTRLMYTDPEAMRRHILAQRKQEQREQQQRQDAPQEAEAGVANLQQQQEQQQEEEQQQDQQQQEEQERQVQDPYREQQACVGPAEASAPVCLDAGAARGGSGEVEREVLLHSTKENLPGPAPGTAGAAAAAAGAPIADGSSAAGGTKSAKATLTAIAEQYGGSRLRREGSARQLPAAGPAQQQSESVSEPAPASAAAAADAAQSGQAERAAAVAAPAYQLTAADHVRVEALQSDLVRITDGLVLESLEGIHGILSRLAVAQRLAQDRDQVAAAALAAVHEWRAGRQQAGPRNLC